MNRSVLLAALFASLAFNVFVAGAFVGSRLQPERSERPSAPRDLDRRDRNPVTAALRTLSPEAQAAWRAQTPAFQAAHGAELRESRHLIQEAIAGLGSDPFDAARARTDFERARALEQNSRRVMDRRLVEFAAKLSPEDRAQLARALVRPRQCRSSRQAAAPDTD